MARPKRGKTQDAPEPPIPPAKLPIRVVQLQDVIQELWESVKADSPKKDLIGMAREALFLTQEITEWADAQAAERQVLARQLIAVANNLKRTP